MSRHTRACLWLVLATILWGTSFPLVKAILLRQQVLVPEAGSAFFAALGIVVRFALAALIMALCFLRTLPTLTRLEFQQGLSLAFFGGIGIVLQMDGLAHTQASTSAFLTQFYCLILPVWIGIKERRMPGLPVIVSCLLVVAGAAVLTGVNLTNIRIGRGELETLLAATFFTGQILALDNPKYAQNRTGNFTVIMFALTAVLNLPLAIAFAPNAGAFVKSYADWPVIWMMAGLVACCTLAAYLLMNLWQRCVSPVEAGIIYCFEPVAASAFALVMPAWLAAWAAIDYRNEIITQALLLGGGLILMANVLIQVSSAKKTAPVDLEVAPPNRL